jgi:GAF domain-containing protein
MNKKLTTGSGEGKKKPEYHFTIRYTVVGVAFGLVFPLVATIIVLFDNSLPFNIASVGAIHYFEPLLWIIDTAPLVLGLFAALIGRREDRLEKSRQQLEAMVGTLEERVTATSRDLDRAIEVSHTVSQVDNLDDMLAQAVELIRASFDLYYVQAYLLDANDRNLVLRAGTGTIGQTLVNQNHRLPLGLGSIVGSSALEKRTIVVANTATSEVHQPNPLLPDTCSEMAMPLILGDKVVGVLDLQSDVPGKLADDTVPPLEAVAGQLAVAIQNSRLIVRTKEASLESEYQVRQNTRRGWQDFLDAVERNEFVGFTYEAGNVTPLNQPLINQPGGSDLFIPILITDEPVGSIRVQGEKDHEWSPYEQDIAAAVAERVATQVESLRLLSEADHFRSEAEDATRRLIREGWEEYLLQEVPHGTGYEYQDNRVNILLAEPNGDAHAATIKQELKVRGETIGRLEIAQADDLDDDAIDLAAAVAVQLSAHLEVLRLSEQTERALAETEQQAQRLAELNELSQALSSAVALDGVYKVAAANINRIVPANRISIALLDPGKDRFEIFALNGESGATKVGVVTSTEGSVLATAVKQKRVVAMNQAREVGLPGIESFMVAPLTAGGQTFGTLNLGHSEPNAFEPGDEQLLLQVASILASTLESQRLFDEIVHRAEDLATISKTAQNRAEELAILNEMGRTLTSVTDRELIMTTVYQHATRLIQADSFYISLFDENRDEVVFRIFGEGEEISESASRRRSGNGITEYVIRTRKPLLIKDELENRIEELGIEAQGRMAMSWLGVPMTTGDQVVGVLAVQSFERTNAFDEHHRELLTAVANQAVIALENASLFDQAQMRAKQERLLREITARVRNSADVDTVMRTAAQEVGRALGRQTFIYLGDHEDEIPFNPVEET